MPRRPRPGTVQVEHIAGSSRVTRGLLRPRCGHLVAILGEIAALGTSSGQAEPHPKSLTWQCDSGRAGSGWKGSREVKHRWGADGAGRGGRVAPACGCWGSRPQSSYRLRPPPRRSDALTTSGTRSIWSVLNTDSDVRTMVRTIALKPSSYSLRWVRHPRRGRCARTSPRRLSGGSQQGSVQPDTATRPRCTRRPPRAWCLSACCSSRSDPWPGWQALRSCDRSLIFSRPRST